jgi:hypothetical protein
MLDWPLRPAEPVKAVSELGIDAPIVAFSSMCGVGNLGEKSKTIL